MALSKATADRHQRQLLELLKLPGNDVCADCGAQNPRWASWDLGIFLCVKCAQSHRSLGTHISKVKSLTLDQWTKEQLESMRSQGNIKSNAKFVADPLRNGAPSAVEEGDRDSLMDRYIRNKYQFKMYMTPTVTATPSNTSNTSNTPDTTSNSRNTNPFPKSASFASSLDSPLPPLPSTSLSSPPPNQSQPQPPPLAPRPPRSSLTMPTLPPALPTRPSSAVPPGRPSTSASITSISSTATGRRRHVTFDPVRRDTPELIDRAKSASPSLGILLNGPKGMDWGSLTQRALLVGKAVGEKEEAEEEREKMAERSMSSMGMTMGRPNSTPLLNGYESSTTPYIPQQNLSLLTTVGKFQSNLSPIPPSPQTFSPVSPVSTMNGTQPRTQYSQSFSVPSTFGPPSGSGTLQVAAPPVFVPSGTSTSLTGLTPGQQFGQSQGPFGTMLQSQQMGQQKTGGVWDDLMSVQTPANTTGQGQGMNGSNMGGSQSQQSQSMMNTFTQGQSGGSGGIANFGNVGLPPLSSGTLPSTNPFASLTNQSTMATSGVNGSLMTTSTMNTTTAAGSFTPSAMYTPTSPFGNSNGSTATNSYFPSTSSMSKSTSTMQQQYGIGGTGGYTTPSTFSMSSLAASLPSTTPNGYQSQSTSSFGYQTQPQSQPSFYSANSYGTSPFQPSPSPAPHSNPFMMTTSPQMQTTSMKSNNPFLNASQSQQQQGGAGSNNFQSFAAGYMPQNMNRSGFGY